MSADLHIHTSASDGLLSPRDIVAQAKAAGLSHIAITDHDTVAGLQALKDEQISGIAIIPGIEFSTDLPLNEVHILGYYIDINHPELNRQIDIIARARLRRIDQMLVKLNKLGYPINYRRILDIAGATPRL